MTTATTAVVWLGVAFIGGVGSVLRFVIDRAVARRVSGRSRSARSS